MLTSRECVAANWRRTVWSSLLPSTFYLEVNRVGFPTAVCVNDLKISLTLGLSQCEIHTALWTQPHWN